MQRQPTFYPTTRPQRTPTHVQVKESTLVAIAALVCVMASALILTTCQAAYWHQTAVKYAYALSDQ